jgi:hypothetical protein
MPRIPSIAFAVTLSIFVASPAFAVDFAPTHVAGGTDKKFPMPAADFRKHVAAREEKARDHLEKYIVRKELDKDQADAVRARFDAALAKLDKRVDEVCADGTVTQDEADSVHALAKELLHSIRSEK